MIEATIESVRLSLMTSNLMVVILKEVGGKRRLPIFVGRPEGDAIVFHLNGEQPQRPMTHDLAINVLRSIGAQLVHVLIADLRGDYYYAQLVFRSGSETFSIDARPSDAMALAVRAGCPIYIDEDVMAVAGVVPEQEEGEVISSEGEDLGAFEDFIRSLDLEDLDKRED